MQDGKEIGELATEMVCHREVLRFCVLLKGLKTLDIVSEHLQEMENEGLRENAVGICTNRGGRFLR